MAASKRTSLHDRILARPEPRKRGRQAALFLRAARRHADRDFRQGRWTEAERLAKEAGSITMAALSQHCQKRKSVC